MDEIFFALDLEVVPLSEDQLELQLHAYFKKKNCQYITPLWTVEVSTKRKI